MELHLAIAHPVLLMKLAPDHRSATMGTISGVIGTEEFIASLKEDGEAFDKGLCTPDDPANWAEQIRQASDIMKDGTQDPTKTCDGISIGLGFDAKLIQLGGVAPAQPQPPDPCGPAP